MNISSKEVWCKDSIKLNKVRDKGFSVLIVWEKDWDENPNEVISKCMKFLIRGD